MTLGELSFDELASRCAAGQLAWRTGPFVSRFRSALRWAARQIAYLYADYPLVDPRTEIVDFDVAVDGRCFAWVTVHVDGAPQHRWFRRHLAMPLVEWAFNRALFSFPHQHVKLHAAVVARDNLAAILPAPPGSGKSTLCAALVHSGWRLLSDEVALIRPEDAAVLPVPRPVGLKERSIEVIRRFAPAAEIGPVWPGTPKGRVAHMRAPADSVRRADEPAQPAWLIFPKFQEGAGVRLEPLTKARAALRAADNSFNYTLLGQVAFETVCDVADRCECFELAYGDLDQALDSFADLAASVCNVCSA